MISPMVEAALRSLLVAAAVAAGLRALRVRNVLAQKSAWTLVLAAALAMPLLLPLAGRFQILPDTATISLPAHPLSRFAAFWPRPAAYVAAPRTASQATPSFQAEPMHRRTPDSETIGRTPSAGSLNYVVSNVYQGDPAGTVPQAAPTIRHTLSFADLAWLAYLGVAVTLLFRLFVGLASALLIWMGAAPVTLRNAPGLVEGLAVRSSREVASPVTIGSAVVLPADYADWDMEKLRIVLAHERSHIRQGDFYLQFLAGLYAAVVWFSPLGWWLKSKLSDLAETISDRAGLEQAVDCASYAQILLEFAAAPRPTLTGVAMARSGSLSRRIERLLNDHNFRQAFAGGRGRVLVAVLLVPMSLFVATSLIRVKAAGQAAQLAPAAPAAPPAPAPAAEPETPVTGQAKPEPDAVTTVSPVPDVAPPAPREPMIAPAPPAHIEPRIAPVTPAAPNGRIIVVPKIASRVIVVPEVPAMTIRVPDTARIMALAQVDSFNFRYSMNGESWGIVRGNGEHVQFSGDLHTADIDKIRKVAHGDFLWFKRGDKYYYVDDPATLAHVEAMYKPMDELGKQQEELGRKQEELGRQQEALGRKQEQVSVPTPNISKEIAELNAAMAKLQAKMGKTVTQEELADLQGKLGDLQGRLGDIQGEMGAKQGAFGAQQGQLGEQQGRLGAEQGRLGAEQGRIAMEADRKVKSIIDESLQNGKAHPVE
jgi:BlaR1 peptidase M56